MIDATEIARDWGSLIAGLLGVGAGVIAYAGAMRAASRQVDAIEQQIADARQARAAEEERGRHAIRWAVRLEALRIERAALERRREGFPSQPGWSNMDRPDARIAESPLLRGERAEFSLLSKEEQDSFGALASWVHQYNSHVDTRRASADGLLVDQGLLDMLDQMIERAGTIAY